MYTVSIKPPSKPKGPFIVCVNNRAVEMKASDLASFQRFNTRIIEVLHLSLPYLPPDEFNTMINGSMVRENGDQDERHD